VHPVVKTNGKRCGVNTKAHGLHVTLPCHVWPFACESWYVHAAWHARTRARQGGAQT